MLRDARTLLVALGVAAALVAGITTWRLVDSPLRYDETDFAAQAAGIIQHGVPKVVAHGEVRYGMWHPPLYLYSLGASLHAFGQSNRAARTAGVIWFAALATLMWVHAGPTAVALALLSPLVAHGIFFLDIDNTSLGFAVVLFGIAFVASSQSRSTGTTVVLAAILFLGLWSKLTTPFVALGAAMVFHALNRDAVAVREVATAGLAATAGFFASYFLYCYVAGYPASFMFETTYAGKSDAYLQVANRSLTQSLHAVWWNVVWFSPALALLFGLVTVERIWAYWKAARVQSIDYWVLLAWCVLGAYAVWGGVMGKYTYPGAVAAAIAVALWLAGQLGNVRVTKPVLFGAAVAALAIIHVAGMPPLQVKEPSEQAVTLASGLANPRMRALLLVVIGFGVFTAVAMRAMTGRGMSRVAAALLVCAIVANTAEAFKLMLSPDDRSPYRPFRERGFEPMVESLNDALLATDTIIAPKDVGYYFKGRSHRLDAIRYEKGESAVDAAIRSSHIEHAVDSAVNPVDGSDRLFRAAGLEVVARVGDFLIYGKPH